MSRKISYRVRQHRTHHERVGPNKSDVDPKLCHGQSNLPTSTGFVVGLYNAHGSLRSRKHTVNWVWIIFWYTA